MQAIVYWIVNTCTCVNDKNAGVFFNSKHWNFMRDDLVYVYHTLIKSRAYVSSVKFSVTWKIFTVQSRI